jgi:tRNA dimethylallyltransferase
VLDRFEFPGTDEAVRRRLESELAEVGAPKLHARLAEVDPVAAGNILVDNGRRIVRALEVVEITGRPFSATLPMLEYADPHTVQIGVDIDRATLDERIERRVAGMFAAGFVAEVERLLAAGLREGRTAASAIGYREVTAYLDGDLTLDEARQRTVVATRRFARRQDSWFRKDPRVTWVRYDDPQRLERALGAVGPWARG